MKRALIIFTLLIFASASNATEATDSEKYFQQMADAGNKTIKLLIDKFYPHIKSSDKDLLSSTNIKVAVYADFNAFSDYKNRKIIIPLGFVIENYLQIEGLTQVYKNPSLNKKYLNWIKYLNQRSDRAAEDFRSGKKYVDDTPITPFWSYIGLDAPPYFTNKERAVQEDMMVNVMALVLAHEMGHIVLKHKPYSDISPKESQKQEFEADAFGADLVHSSGMSVLPGLTAYLERFGSHEAAYKKLSQNANTHPPVECRYYRIGIKETSAMLKNPNAAEDFERTSNLTISDFHDFLDSLKSKCSTTN